MPYIRDDSDDPDEIPSGDSWVGKVTGEKNTHVVIADGKNSQNSLVRELRKKGFPAHIFVRREDGSYVHNPMFKGNNYSDAQTREDEAECVRKLHDSHGVGAVVLYPSLGTEPRELAPIIDKIHAISPDIKIITMGADTKYFGGNPEEYDKMARPFMRYQDDKKIIYPDDPEFPLAKGIDALITNLGDDDSLVKTIKELVPQSVQDLSQQ